MVYELSVEYIDPPSEVLDGEDFQVLLSIKNIGTNTFPGGIITRFDIEYTIGPAVSEVNIETLLEIPQLLPQETHRVKPLTFGSALEGLSWIRFNVNAKDDEKIIFYRDEAKLQNEWVYGLTIKNKVEVETINLLEKILEKLTKLTVLLERDKNE